MSAEVYDYGSVRFVESRGRYQVWRGPKLVVNTEDRPFAIAVFVRAVRRRYGAEGE